jgi:hypothetical protein
MLIGCMALTACSTDDLIRLEVRTAGPLVSDAPAHDPLPSVAVIPFDDARPSLGILGEHHPLVGDSVPIIVDEGRLSDLVTWAMIDFFQRREGWDAWLAVPEVKPADAPSYVTVCGRIDDYAVEGQNHLVINKVIIRIRLTLHWNCRASPAGPSIALESGDSYWLPVMDVQRIDRLLTTHFRRLGDRFRRELDVALGGTGSLQGVETHTEEKKEEQPR